MNTRCRFVRHRLPLLAALLGLCAGAMAQLPPPPVSPAPVVDLEYDARGNFTKSISTRGQNGFNLTTGHDYDRLNRRFKTTNAAGKAVSYGHNGREDLTQVTDPRNLVTQYLRNGLGEATSVTSPDTGTATHTYDAAGNLITRTDSRGVLATHTYDVLNRLTSVAYTHSGQDSQVFNWTYDQTGAGFSYGLGRLTSTQFPSGAATYAYDALGRLVSTTQTVTAANTVSLSTGYGYDSAGRITSVTYPSGRVLYIPHTGGQPTGMSLAPNGGARALVLINWLDFEPGPGGPGAARAWSWVLNSGTMAHARVFDIYGRMVRYPLGGALRDLTYDAADRIVSYTHWNAISGVSVPALDQGFGYDELGRVTSASTGVGSWTYAYDDNGNRTVTSHKWGQTRTRSHTTAADSNRLLSLSNPTRQFTHDPAGNTVSDLEGGLRIAVTHDLAARVARIDSNLSDEYSYSAAYLHNNDGLRVLKRYLTVQRCFGAPVWQQVCVPTDLNSTVFVYDQAGLLLGEYDDNTGAPRREYVWLQGMPVAVIDGPVANPAIYYVQTDHLGAPRVLLDRAGVQRWTWVAEPFGNSKPIEDPVGFGPVALNLRMPGQYYDVESGLAYNWHRSYDSGLGRYTQSDPIGLAGGINTYAYVESQPTSLIDPLGLATYMCRAPLHALTGALGEGRATWAMSNVPMAHHRYLCVPGQCGGQDQRGEKWSDPLWGPGKKSKDEFNAERCEQKEPDNTCIEICVRRRLDGPRPTYGIPLATDCQEWAEEVLNSCRYECSSSTPTDRPYIGYPSSGRRSKR